uniref:Putative salivary serpin n=1 Tax=Corethrella appendiculata TaxID=1370023 RepID=U5EJM7_9DIPT
MSKQFLLFLMLIFSTTCNQASSSSTSKALNEFSVDLFREIFNSNENIIISPYSIRLALTMLYGSATGKTKIAMKNALKFDENIFKFASQFSREMKMFNEIRSNENIKIANKIFTNSALRLNEKFAKRLENVFDTKIRAINTRDKKLIAEETNRWAANVTDNMIDKIMSPEDVPNDLEALLLSAIALQANWLNKFSVIATKTANFYGSENSIGNVQMMSQTNYFPYGKSDELDAEFIELPYERDSDLAMWILLPSVDSNLKKLLSKFNLNALKNVRSNARNTRINLQIPKFEFKYEITANNALENLGLKSIFDEGEFQIYTNRASSINSIKQNAYVKVDEQGTRAAAITSIIVTTRMVLPAIPVVANRPFMFMILKASTQELLFIGSYVNSS